MNCSRACSATRRRQGIANRVSALPLTGGGTHGYHPHALAHGGTTPTVNPPDLRMPGRNRQDESCGRPRR